MKSLILTAAIALVSCHTNIQRAEVANGAKQSMLGMSKANLITCAGAPLRSSTINGTEYLTYSHADAYSDASSKLTGILVGSALYFECTATFSINNGRISKVTFSGKTGGKFTQGAACYNIVAQCVP